MKTYLIIRTDKIYIDEYYYHDTTETVLTSFSTLFEANRFVEKYNYPKTIGENIIEILSVKEIETFSSADETEFKEKFERQPIQKAKYLRFGMAMFEIISLHRLEADKKGNIFFDFEVKLLDERVKGEHEFYLDFQFWKNEDYTLWVSNDKELKLFCEITKMEHELFKDCKWLKDIKFSDSDFQLFDKNKNEIRNWNKGIVHCSRIYNR